MTQQDVVYVDSDAHDEKLFRQWLERFDASVDLLLKIENTSDTSTETPLAEFSKKLLECIDIEANTYPKWIEASVLEETSSSLIPVTDDLKTRIKQLMLPSALQHFQRLFSDRGACIALHQHVCDAAAQHEYALQLETLLTHLDSCCHDDFVALCRLSEVHQRLYIASDRDTRRAEAWLQRESARFAHSANLLTSLNVRCQQLERTPGTVISTGLEKIKEVCDAKDKELQTAIAEEEAARLAFEAARQRKQTALQASNTVKALYCQVDEQSQAVRAIAAKRAEIEKFNSDSAKKREELVSAYCNFASASQEKVIHDDLSKSVPSILRSMLHSFASLLWPSDASSLTSAMDMGVESIFGPYASNLDERHSVCTNGVDVVVRSETLQQPTKDITLGCMGRLGLEMIRLWRQLNGGVYYEDAARVLSEYEDFFASRATVKETPSTSRFTKYVNATIVLYYEHYEHGTPAGHVESNARYTEAMAVLQDQASNEYPDSENSGKRVCVRKRDMFLLKCDDVVSPPLWVFPLIHSTTYLKNLAMVSKEAQEGDLYVPLEFDSEYEEDSEAESEADDIPPSAIPWEVAGDALSGLQQELDSLLKPLKGDKAVKQLLQPRQMLPLRLPASRQRQISAIRNSHQKSGLVENSRITTAMGGGIVQQSVRPDGILVVKLDFGAIGYFHSSQVKPCRTARRIELSATTRQTLQTWLDSLPPDPSEDQLRQADSIDLHLQHIVDVLSAFAKKDRIVAEELNVPLNVLRAWQEDPSIPWLCDVVNLRVKILLCKEPFDNIIARVKDSLAGSAGKTVFDTSSEIGKLKFLGKTLHTRLGISQTQFGMDLCRKEPLRQASVSAWFCGRMEQTMYNRVAHYIYTWLQMHTASMTPDEKSMLESLSEWINEVPFIAKSEREIIRGRPPTRPKVARATAPKRVAAVPAIDICAVSDAQLIDAFKQYLSANHISQTQAAEMIAARYPIRANQNMVSGWTRQVTSPKITLKMNEYVRAWLKEGGCSTPESASTTQHEATAETLPDISNDAKQTAEVNTTEFHVNGDSDAMKTAEHTTKDQAEDDEIDIFSSSESDIFSADEDEAASRTISPSADSSLFDSEQDETRESPKDRVQALTSSATRPRSRVTLASSRSRRQFSKRTFDDYFYDEIMNSHESESDDDDAMDHDEEDDASVSVANESETHVKKRRKSSHGETAMTPEANVLRLRVIEEMRRRKLSQAVTFFEAKMERDLHTFSRFLNGGYTCHALEEALEKWLEFSANKEGHCTDSKEELCTLCGRSSNDFSSAQGFARHTGWCRSKNASGAVSSSSTTLTSNSTPIKTEHKVEKIISKGEHTQFERERYKGRSVAVADTFKPDFHYSSCEICGQNSMAHSAKCASCPCIYHFDCMSTSDSFPELWHCPKCIESGASTATPLTYEDFGNLRDQKWILIYSHTLRRWRQGYAMEIDPDNGFYLCRWWRADGKWGKSSYVDARKADVLWSPTLRGPTSTTPPKTAPQGSTAEVAPISKPSTDKQVKKVGRPRKHDTETKSKSKQSVDAIEGGDDIATDTYIGAESLRAAICTLGVACRAIDLVVCGENTNAFLCTRPPGHHAGRRGCTDNCIGTGFCLMNNAAAAVIYARVRWGLERVAVVDIDAHFGNGTAELLRGDPKSFFGCVHMVYGDKNQGFEANDCCGKDWLEQGFFPSALGCTEILDNFVSVGVFPERQKSDHASATLYGPEGFRSAFKDTLLPKLEKFDPQLLIISAGFDGFASDPLGGELGLTAGDISWITSQLVHSMQRSTGAGGGRVVSFLEGGYDTSKKTSGLASSVDAHVRSLRNCV